MRAEDDDGAKAQSTASKKSWLNPNTEAWNKAVAALKSRYYRYKHHNEALFN